MVDGVATDITINDLKEFLLPVRQIDNIISSFVDLVNPTRWGRVIEVMLKHKGEIEKMEPTDQQNLINAIQNYEYEVKTYDVILRVKPEKAGQIHTEEIAGKKCLVIPMEENEHATINGVNTQI